MADSGTTSGSSTAPPFVTGGGGFDYEDLLAAFVMAAMISRQPPFGEDIGLIRRIDWQVAKDGWEFDDLLLTCADVSSRRVALSCKAGRYITGNKWPADGSRRLWTQWTRGAPNPFRREVDVLGVVTGNLAQRTGEAWGRLLEECIKADPARFVQRIAGKGASSQAARDLVASLACPSELAQGVSGEPEERARLIRHVRLWHRDLLALDSSNRSMAIGWCQQSLADGDRSMASRLFDTLRGIAAEHRIRGGTLELRELVARLVPAFALKDAPDRESAWRVLDTRSRELAASVSDSIAGKICLTHSDVAGVPAEASAFGRVAIIEGESGAGKSALAKRWSCRYARTLWLTAADLEGMTLADVGRTLGVSLLLSDLLDQDQVASGILIIDGAERLTDTARRLAAQIVALAARAARPWLVVVTTQEEGADALIAALDRAGIDAAAIVPVKLSLPSESIIAQILPALPIRLAGSPSRGLLQALRNLKALDLAVRYASRRVLTTFSDLADQICTGLVGSTDKHARAHVLKALGRADAQSLTGSVPASALDGTDEQRVAAGLIADGVLLSRQQRYLFRHDLLGDWARFLVLVEAGESVGPVLIEYARNLRWAPAIRLFAESLSQGGDAERTRLVNLLAGGPSRPERLVLLEGVFRSVDAAPVLSDLLARSGSADPKALAELLRTFLAAATRPSNISMMLRRDHPVGVAARAAHRVPVPELWPGVVKVLESHRATLAALLPVLVGDVSRMWLADNDLTTASEYASTTRACAQLAVSAARELQARLAMDGWRHDEDSPVFEGLLLAAPWLPDDVTQVALEMSGRRPDPPEVKARVAAERKRVTDAVAARLSKLTKEELAERKRGFSIGPPPHRKRKRVADGPFRPVSEAFRRAVLNGAALTRLAAATPHVAQEVLLACCLEGPDEDDPLYLSHSHDPHSGTVDEFRWHPPLYARGPWVTFLRRLPEQGLESILGLAAVGTTEWLRLFVRPGDKNHDWMVKWSTIALDFDGQPRVFRGGGDVFGWYRAHGRPGNLMASALMALEFWLYERLDAGQPVEWAIQRMLGPDSSVALLGVLAALARRQPSLLDGPLRPLATSWMVLDWDQQLTVQAQMPDMDPFNLQALGQTWFEEEAERWAKLPHRTINLSWLVATKLVLGSQDIVTACAAARARWRAEIDSGQCPSPETVERYIALLDPANLSAKDSGPGQVEVHVQWPPELAAKYEERATRSQLGTLALEIRGAMRKLLEAGNTLTNEQAEHVWKAAALLSNRPELGGESNDGVLAAACVAAASALELLAGGWLDSFPERRVWCEEVILRKRPASDRPRMLRGVSRYQEHVEGFIGVWALARLATGDERPIVRQTLAEAMTTDEPVVTAQVLAAACAIAERLPEELGQLFNLFWLWAALENVSPSSGAAEEPQMRIAISRRRRLVQAFVGRRLPNDPIPWHDLRLRAARVAERHERRRQSRRLSWIRPPEPAPKEQAPLPVDWEGYGQSGFSPSTLEPAIELLPVVVRPSAGTRLSPLIDLDRRALDLVGFSMSRATKRDRNRDAHPDLFDRYALGRVTTIMAGHVDEAHVRATWEWIAPRLAVCAEWCEVFFDAWFRQPRRTVETAQSFHDRWNWMVQAVASMPEWQSADERWPHHLIQAWSALLGVHERGTELGIEQDRQVLTALQDIYAAWAKRSLADRWRLRMFCAFLQRPGASGLRAPALVWVNRAMNDILAHRDADRDLVLEVIGFCVVAWHGHRNEILTSPESRDALVGIVQLFSRMRVQEIMELKEELEAATSGAGGP